MVRNVDSVFMWMPHNEVDTGFALLCFVVALRWYILPVNLKITSLTPMPLQWRHNGRDSVSNHQPSDCFLIRLFRGWSKKTSKLRVTGLCAGNSPVTDEFPAQMASNAENDSIWWCHHAIWWSTHWWWSNPEEYGEFITPRAANYNKTVCTVKPLI